MWWCTGGRLTTWGRWRCWHTDACRPRCRKAYRRPSRRTLSSRRDRWSRCPCRRSEGEGWSLEQEAIVDRQQVKRSKSLPVWIVVCFISTQTNWWSWFQLGWKIAVTFKSRHKTAGQQWIAHTTTGLITKCVAVWKKDQLFLFVSLNTKQKWKFKIYCKCVKCLTNQSQEQEENPKSIRFELRTHGSETGKYQGWKPLLRSWIAHLNKWSCVDNNTSKALKARG